MCDLVCTRADVCEKAEGCPHAVPHEGPCGVAMPCYDDPSGEISWCAEVEKAEEIQKKRDIRKISKFEITRKGDSVILHSPRKTNIVIKRSEVREVLQLLRSEEGHDV